MTTPTELQMWRDKYQVAKTRYNDELNKIKEFNDYYEGSRNVKTNPNVGLGYGSKLATNVINITHELVESQIDTSVPSPKVTAVHPKDADKAQMIEDFIKSELKRLKAEEINDLQERTTYITGSSFTAIDWDNSKGYHCNIGDLAMTDIYPDEVIPQPGVDEFEKMDYFFIRQTQTRDYIRRRFGKIVPKGMAETETTDTANEDLVTLITAYYRNDEGGIGLYRWCDKIELENFKDYQARHQLVCKECGKPKGNNEVCECGCKEWIEDKDDMDTITLFSEVVEGVDEMGIPNITQTEMEVTLPYYKPNIFPVVNRKNISHAKHFLGKSDVEVIIDLQDEIKKYGTQISEKLHTGGSIVALPENLAIELTDEQLRVVRLQDQNQMSMINTFNLQPDTSQDMNALNMNYQWAKSILGITDALQGKHDASIRSASGRTAAIQQANGRLQSKRVMKQNAYARLFELMFKFALAYADQPIPIQGEGLDGEQLFSSFDKSMFVEQDADGEWYWNDEFIFEVDATSVLNTNRADLWNQADLKLQSGAFGPLGDLQTNRLYWFEQQSNGYPHAGEILKQIDMRIEQQNQQMAMQQQMMPQMEGEM